MTTMKLFTCTLAGLALAGGLAAGTGRVSAQVTARTGQGAPKYRVLFNHFQAPTLTIFIADADGKNERALVAPGNLAYSPRYSHDGQWIVYTAERDGLSDIYRMHPDGSSIERLTDHRAFDDQGALSPDGTTLAFVSTRGGGTADVWLMDLKSKTYRNLTKHHS